MFWAVVREEADLHDRVEVDAAAEDNPCTDGDLTHQWHCPDLGGSLLQNLIQAHVCPENHKRNSIIS